MATPSIELRDTPLHVDAEHKVTRFFLKSLDLNSNNADIVAGAYVNLMTRYYWTDRNTCEIDIGWETWHNENNGTNYYHLQTGEFTASNKIYLQVLNENSGDTQSALYSCIANTQLDDIVEGDNPSGHWILYHYDEDNFGELRAINDTLYNPQCKIRISNLEETEKITIGFGYQFNGEGLTEYILATGDNAPDAGSYHNGTYYYLDNGNYINIPENPYIAVQDNSEVTSTNYVNYYINDGENNYIAPTEYDPNETYYEFDGIIFDANTDYYIVKPVDPSSLFLINFKILSNGISSLNKYINILKPSRYDNNVIFNKAGLDEFVKNIKNYPIINIEEITSQTTWNNYTGGKPCLKVTYGDNTKDFSGYTQSDGTAQSAHTTGFQYVPVGSNIKFKDSEGNDVSKLTSPVPAQKTGTFRVLINSDTFEVPIFGLSGGTGAIELGGDLLPTIDDTYDIGSISDNDPDTAGTQKRRWQNLYITGDIGASSDPINAIYVNNIGASSAPVNAIYVNNINTPSGSSLSMTGPLSISNTNDGIQNTTRNANGSTTLPSTITPNTNASIYTNGGIYAKNNIYGERVFNAVFNDYAECRTTIDLAPGHVVIDNDDGSLSCSNTRLQPGAQVISDTYGHLMGTTDTATTPIAVAGRVLVYTYQPRENYHAGMAVCSAPDGTVDIMTREEIRNYPDCIIGIVSEIPQYDVWGSDNVKVDGRIWIKVK